MEQWQKFANLFDGFSKAFGQYTAPKKTDRGKFEGKALTVKGQTNLSINWTNHLDGKTGIGIIPLRDDDTCLFGVIDIDVYNLDHAALETTIKNLGLPLVICKSKSGGAHCYLFLKEPVAASVVRERLDSWSAAMGYGGVEVFPKQSYRVSPEDMGNWINLPYFDAKQTSRPAYVNGKDLSLDEFLEHAEKSKATQAEIETVKGTAETFSDPEGLLDGAPPCLLHYGATGGVPEGSRNEGMFNFAAYLKKRFPDDWQDKLPTYNQKFVDPPLPLSEINGIVKSISRKEYDLKCNGPYCNKKKCRFAAFGVGETSGGAKRPEIGNITKYEGDPVYWAIEIDGHRVLCDTQTLLSQNHFNAICMEKINRIPGSMPKHRWERYIDSLLEHVDVVTVPEDASKKGQFYSLLDTFCTMTSRQAKQIDEVRQGKPYRHEGKVYFMSRFLFEFLEEKRFRYESEHKVWQWLYERGAEKDFKKIKGKGTNLWVINDFEQIQDDGKPNQVFEKEEF